MSIGDRLFLDGKGIKKEDGSSTPLEFTFTSEKDLDEALWFDPEHADKPLKNLLHQHGGEISPVLSRLALKAVTIPLFLREFQGEEAGESTETAVNHVALQNSILLDAYLEMLGDESINQEMVKQAIADATIMQLISRSFRSNEQDDVILLPVSPPKYYESQKTNFTVLRRKKIGRAHLLVSNKLEAIHRQEPNIAPYRILVDPQEISGPDASIESLAEVLVAEQQLEGITGNDFDYVSAAAGRLFTKINTHFDKETV